MDLVRSLPGMMSFMGTSFRAQLPCVWLPGHAPWMHTGWCTAVAWRPATQGGLPVQPAPRRGRSRRVVRRASTCPASPWRAASTRPAPHHCRLPGFLRFRDRSAWVCLSYARSAPLRFSKTSTVCCQRVFLRAVCCSGAPAGACAPP